MEPHSTELERLAGEQGGFGEPDSMLCLFVGLPPLMMYWAIFGSGAFWGFSFRRDNRVIFSGADGFVDTMDGLLSSPP